MKAFERRVNEFLGKEAIVTQLSNLLKIKPPYFLYTLIEKLHSYKNTINSTNLIEQMTPNVIAEERAETRNLIDNSIEEQQNQFQMKFSFKKRQRKTSVQIDVVKDDWDTINEVNEITEETEMSTINEINDIIVHKASNMYRNSIWDCITVLPSGCGNDQNEPLPISHMILNSKLVHSLFSINQMVLSSNYLGKSHQKILLEIKNTMDYYPYTFNCHAYTTYFIPAYKKLQSLYEIKFKKNLAISKNYKTQIKDTQFYLLKDDQNDDRDIQVIIDSLIEEQKHELMKVDEEFDKSINEERASFKGVGFHWKNDITILKDKLKIDIFKLMLQIFNPIDLAYKIKDDSNSNNNSNNE